MEFLEAVLQNDIEVFQSYIQSGNSVNVFDKHGNSALHLTKDIETIRILLHSGVNPGDVNNKQQTPLHLLFFFPSKDSIAYRWNKMDDTLISIAKMLVEADSNLNLQDEDQRTPLHNVFLFGGEAGLSLKEDTIMAITNMYLRNGAEPNIPDYEGRTPLHYAVGSSHHDVVRLLLENGADVNAQSLDGCTPLHLIYHHEDQQLATILLVHHVDLSLVDKNGQTVLHYAAPCGYPVIIKILLDHSPDILDMMDKNGLTALHLASAYKQIDVVNLLLSYNAKVDCKDRFGATPLHYASWGGTVEIVEALIIAGSAVDVRDTANQFPKDCAVYYHFYHVLKQFGKECLAEALGIPISSDEETEDLAIIQSLPADDIYDIFVPSSRLNKDPTYPSILPDDFHTYLKVRTCGNPDQYVTDVQTVPGVGRIPNIEENVVMKMAIESFVYEWVKVICEIDARFEGDVLPSGSVYEGTKVEHPYEYDYMIVLKKFSKSFTTQFSQDTEFNDVNIQYNEFQGNKNLLEFCHDGNLMSISVIEKFAMISRKALAKMEYESGHQQLYVLGFTEETFVNDTWVDIRTVTCNLKMAWTGPINKHISLSIDLVPAISIVEWPCIATTDSPLITADIKSNGCHLVSKQHKWRLSFSLAEQHILKGLADEQLSAYIGAKTLMSGAAFLRMTIYDDTNVQKMEKNPLEEDLFHETKINVQELEHENQCSSSIYDNRDELKKRCPDETDKSEQDSEHHNRSSSSMSQENGLLELNKRFPSEKEENAQDLYQNKVSSSTNDEEFDKSCFEAKENVQDSDHKEKLYISSCNNVHLEELNKYCLDKTKDDVRDSAHQIGLFDIISCSDENKSESTIDEHSNVTLSPGTPLREKVPCDLLSMRLGGDIKTLIKPKDQSHQIKLPELSGQEDEYVIVLDYENNTENGNDEDVTSVASSDIDTFTFQPYQVIPTYYLKMIFLQLLHEKNTTIRAGAPTEQRMVTTKDIFQRLYELLKNDQQLSYFFVPRFDMFSTMKDKRQNLPKMLLVLYCLEEFFKIN